MFIFPRSYFYILQKFFSFSSVSVKLDWDLPAFTISSKMKLVSFDLSTEVNWKIRIDEGLNDWRCIFYNWLNNTVYCNNTNCMSTFWRQILGWRNTYMLYNGNSMIFCSSSFKWWTWPLCVPCSRIYFTLKVHPFFRIKLFPHEAFSFSYLKSALYLEQNIAKVVLNVA